MIPFLRTNLQRGTPLKNLFILKSKSFLIWQNCIFKWYFGWRMIVYFSYLFKNKMSREKTWLIRKNKTHKWQRICQNFSRWHMKGNITIKTFCVKISSKSIRLVKWTTNFRNIYLNPFKFHNIDGTALSNAQDEEDICSNW